MATLLNLRPVGADPITAAFADGRWVDPDAQVVDAEIDTAGLWALPGLADCHAHLAASSIDELRAAPGAEELAAAAEANAFAQLRSGVFLVLDKGSKDLTTLRLVNAPPSTVPDLEAAGTILTAPGGYYPDFGIEVEPDALADAVRSVAVREASWVKIIGDWPRRGRGPIPNFDEAALAEAVAVAHAADCRVAIHTAAPSTPAMAVAAGVDSVEHGLFLTGDDLGALGGRGGAWVPTIRAMESIRDALGVESSGGRLFQQGLDNVRELLPGARRSGVAVLAGTDLSLAHGAVAREALALIEYGLDAEAAVDAVSTAAYRHTGRPEGFGVGGPADAVFFAADPREQPETLLAPVLAIRHGEVFRPEAPK